MKLDMKSDDLKQNLAKLGSFFYIHGRMIFFVLFISALIGAVLSLNLTLGKPSDDAYRSEKMNELQSPRFDTETIDKIKDLNSRQQTATDPIPSGQRVNPFGE